MKKVLPKPSCLSHPSIHRSLTLSILLCKMYRRGAIGTQDERLLYKKRFNKYVFFFLIASLTLPHFLQAVITGSNTQTSLQPTALFPATDKNNTMLGFAMFDNGVFLEDSTTSCVFDDYTQFSGSLLLNGGTLKLKQSFYPDLGTFTLNSGTMDGQNFSHLIYPALSKPLGFPSLGMLTHFCFQKNTMITNTKNCTCFDVSYDDAYLAAGLGTGITSEIVLYSLASNQITPITPVPAIGNIGSTVNCLQWHPGQNYLAVCCSNNTGKELSIYKKAATGTLTKVSEVEMGADVLGCIWHPTGNYLITWKKGSTNQLRCYAFNSTTGALSLVGIQTISGTSTLAHNGFSFSPDGIYLAVGLPQNSNLSELMIFTFADGWLDLIASNNIDATVESVNFDPSGTFIAVALSGAASGPVRIYKFDNEINTLSFQIATTATRNAYDARWNKTGTFVAASYAGGAVGSNEALGTVQVYFYLHDVPINDTRFPVPALLPFFYSMKKTTPATHTTLCWQHDASHFFTTDTIKNIEAYKVLEKNYTIKDLVVEFSSNVNFTAPVEFVGNVKLCSIKGVRARLFLQSESLFIIKSGATLILDNIEIEIGQLSNIICEDDTATLILKDSKILLANDLSFDHGSLIIDNDGTIDSDMGFRIFSYTSAKPLMIKEKSNLTIKSNTTFHYQPSNAKNNLIQLADDTSSLYLEDKTTLSITSTSGLLLTKGQLICNGNVTIETSLQTDSESVLEKGLCLGTGTEADNCSFIIMPVASVFVDGYFINHNTKTDAFTLKKLSTFQLNAGSFFKTYISMINALGEFRRSSESTLLYGPGATITPEPTEF